MALQEFSQRDFDSGVDLVANFDWLPPIAGVCPGVRRGSFSIIVGASHNGKTQLMLSFVEANPDTVWLIITPDERKMDVAIKLLAMRLGYDPKDLMEGEEWTREIITKLWDDHFPFVMIIDDLARDISGMMTQIQERAHHALEEIGRPIDAVVFDYLDHWPDGGGSVNDGRSKALKAKAMAKDLGVAFIALQQVSKDKSDGEELTITSGFGGGHETADLIIAVWMEAFRPGSFSDRAEIKVKVTKNKMRLGGQVTNPLTCIFGLGGRITEGGRFAQGGSY